MTKTAKPSKPTSNHNARELAGLVTRELGRLWGRIRARHPEAPDAVVILASGHDGRGGKWGHWASSRWRIEGELRGEVLVAGEALAPDAGDALSKLPPHVRALAVLLHEAAHAIADARGVQDVSRGGRYHNARYKVVAEELGLLCECAGPHGWNQTTPSLSTIRGYERELESLREVLKGYREPEPEPQAKRRGGASGEEGDDAGEGGQAERTSGVRALALCECPRKIRVSRSVLELGPITCGVCGASFQETQD